MTPAEKLEAAIHKLEALRAESTPGPWSVNIHHNAMHTAEFRAPGPWNGFILVSAHTNDDDPELIVTLHRTIDAQLAILRETLFQLEGSTARAGFIGNEFTLFVRLADAILGEDS